MHRQDGYVKVIGVTTSMKASETGTLLNRRLLCASNFVASMYKNISAASRLKSHSITFLLCSER